MCGRSAPAVPLPAAGPMPATAIRTSLCFLVSYTISNGSEVALSPAAAASGSYGTSMSRKRRRPKLDDMRLTRSRICASPIIVATVVPIRALYLCSAGMGSMSSKTSLAQTLIGLAGFPSESVAAARMVNKRLSRMSRPLVSRTAYCPSIEMDSDVAGLPWKTKSGSGGIALGVCALTGAGPVGLGAGDASRADMAPDVHAASLPRTSSRNASSRSDRFSTSHSQRSA
mmetsp:Transcript_1811/g.5685  ORF Transcript_1811/g.5685 Transcript_1811/m.5685 type:complete len:228 (+) Transcript_1811:435-1118(+)|eukprot:scaffold277714_cov30-Tisochrysis_lutea.AAC.2